MNHNIKRVLTLDGGGAKGIYTIGVLSELEKNSRVPLHKMFDLIYGTSTGAIIASLLALGKSVREIEDLYKSQIPAIMKKSTKNARTKALEETATTIFGDKTFKDCVTNLGIVALDFQTVEPIIFKSSINMAHTAKGSFEPGFGISIHDAVLASCAAMPYFKKRKLYLKNKGVETIAIDGGFVANNPTLFAMVDIKHSLTYEPHEVIILSLGTGQYSKRKESLKQRLFGATSIGELSLKMIETSTRSNEKLGKLLFSEWDIIRINDTNTDIQTDMFESNSDTLNNIFAFGVKSYSQHESEINRIL